MNGLVDGKVIRAAAIECYGEFDPHVFIMMTMERDELKREKLPRTRREA